MKGKSFLTTSAAVLCPLTVPCARADIFGSRGNPSTLDFVPIGNATPPLTPRRPSPF